MSERFIKYIPSEKSAWLRKKHTALYLLLSLAVERARWYQEDCPIGLKQGDAILGLSVCEDAGISRQQYRDALEKGEKFGIWEIVWNPKLTKQQKRTIKGTMKSIVVNIKEYDVWDLNLQSENHIRNHQRTISEPSGNHKQRKEKKEKEEKEEIHTDDLAVVEKKYVDFKEEDFEASSYSGQHNVYYTTTKSEENQTKSELKQRNSNKVKIKPSEEALSLLSYFNESLAKHIPEVVDPPKSNEARHFDLILKSYPPDEIKKVIEFSHIDNFWSALVHTPNYLRTKFSKLLAAMRRRPLNQSSLNVNSKEMMIENNKKHAQDVSRGYQSKTYIIEPLSKALEFTPRFNGLPHVVEYAVSENAFKEQVQDKIRKLGFVMSNSNSKAHTLK